MEAADYYEPVVISATDYFPFGMDMPGRTYQAGDYRFGFNGKEKDDQEEWGDLTHYDYGFRIYNPGIGRFLSVDPLTKSYPWYTPYQFAGNKPIWAIDLDGLEEYTVTYIYNQRQLTGLSVYLKAPNAPYDIERKKRDVNDTSPELKSGFIPPSGDKAYEDRFFQFLRDRGTLQQMLNNTIARGPYNIVAPFGVPPNQSSTPAVPTMTPDPLEISPPTFDFAAIPVQLPTPPAPRLIEDRISVITFGSWSTIPQNASTAISEINGLIGRLQRDPSLTINIEANIGVGRISTDPGRIQAERDRFGLSSGELATGRRDRVLREFRRRARSAGVDENRIQGTVGSRRERSVRIQIFQRQ